MDKKQATASELKQAIDLLKVSLVKSYQYSQLSSIFSSYIELSKLDCHEN